MSTELTVNADDTVSAKWKGPKERGSLFQVMAEGNVKLVNRLDKIELLAVLLCVKIMPFPLGHGEQFYGEVLEKARANPDAYLNDTAKAMTLGDMRKALVVKAGDGCNAPTDSYLQIAVEAQKTPATVV